MCPIVDSYSLSEHLRFSNHMHNSWNTSLTQHDGAMCLVVVTLDKRLTICDDYVILIALTHLCIQHTHPASPQLLPSLRSLPACTTNMIYRGNRVTTHHLRNWLHDFSRQLRDLLSFSTTGSVRAITTATNGRIQTKCNNKLCLELDTDLTKYISRYAHIRDMNVCRVCASAWQFNQTYKQYA